MCFMGEENSLIVQLQGIESIISRFRQFIFQRLHIKLTTVLQLDVTID